MKRRISIDLAAFVLLSALGVASRLLPHPPNFSAIGALALFAGFFFHSWKLAACVPLVSLIVGDLVVGSYEPRLMAVVYLSLSLPVAFRVVLRRGLTPGRVGAGSLAASVVFYLATNFGVWAFSSWYPHDLAGLVSCFAAALPFFRNTLCGDLTFSSILFGSYAFATHWQSHKSPDVCAQLASA